MKRGEKEKLVSHYTKEFRDLKFLLIIYLILMIGSCLISISFTILFATIFLVIIIATLLIDYKRFMIEHFK